MNQTQVPMKSEQKSELVEQEPEKYLSRALKAIEPLENLFTQAEKQGLLTGANVDCQISVIDLRRSAYTASDIRAHLSTSPQPAHQHTITPHQEKLIATAIFDTLVAHQIIAADAVVTWPSLLMFLEDLKNAALPRAN